MGIQSNSGVRVMSKRRRIGFDLNEVPKFYRRGSEIVCPKLLQTERIEPSNRFLVTSDHAIEQGEESC